MTEFRRGGASTIKPRKRNARKDDPSFFGQDLQYRFGPLLLGYNAAHLDLLDATGPDNIRHTEEPGIYEITIRCPTSVSTLTASVVSDGGTDRLEPVDFRTTFRLPLLPVFSYDRECKDAYVNRMMAADVRIAFG